MPSNETILSSAATYPCLRAKAIARGAGTRVRSTERLMRREASLTPAEQGVVDGELVAATLTGDRQAFGRLVEHYQRRVFALAHRYVRNEEEAADLTQRTFLKAFESLDRLEQRQAFAAWLFRIAANLAKNAIRFQATKTFQNLEDAQLSTSPKAEEHLVREAQRVAMRCALEQLPDKQHRCVLLRIDGELSFREIGEIVGCSEASARVNFHHGLKALKLALSDKSEEAKR